MRYTVFGESHGPAIGVVIEQVPPGLALDMDEVLREMDRRAPGRDALSTPRKETDVPRIISGMFEGKTTGTPLCAIIANSDQHSKDYSRTKDLMRPGHADYTGYIRYRGSNDYRGGGHFSGRLTAPVVFAGAVAKQILAQKNIYVGAHIKQIENVSENCFELERLSASLFDTIARKRFPVIDDDAGLAMQDAVLNAKNAQDSVGGVIECAVIGVDAGLGSPDFGANIEGVIAQHMFSIPAVKGIAFGAGFSCVTMRGSQYNDELYVDGDSVYTRTNNNGGINGGISNGMPITFELAIRPTPSIAQKQKTVNIATRENAILEIKGRHDPCVVHRAVPVVEAATALAICELLEGDVYA